MEDRIRDTGILEDWRDRLVHDEDEVPFEAELWFRSSEKRRDQAEYRLRDIIENLGGQVIQQCFIPDIAYHAILGRMPRTQVQAISADSEAYRSIQLLQCEDLMHARPTGQCAYPISDDGETVSLTDEELSQFIPPPKVPENPPLIALFDGMPLTGTSSARQPPEGRRSGRI